MTEHNYIVGNTYTTRAGVEMTFLGVFPTVAGEPEGAFNPGDHLLFCRVNGGGELDTLRYHPDGSYYLGHPSYRDILPPNKVLYLNRYEDGDVYLYNSAQEAVSMHSAEDPEIWRATHIAFPIELPPTYGVDTKGE